MAGKCLCSRIAESFGDMYVDGVCEIDPHDARLAEYLFDGARVTRDFFAREWQLWATSPDVLFILACTPCNPVADSGKREGLASKDVYISVGAVPEVVAFHNIPFFSGEQHHALATLQNGAVLDVFDGNLARVSMLRTPLVPGAPRGVEVFSDLLHAERRRRLGLHYEVHGMDELIGPCPFLSFPSTTPLVLSDILDPPELVSEDLFVDGVITPVRVTFPLSRSRQTVAAIITVGGPTCALFVGARVRLRAVADSPLYVLWSWHGRDARFRPNITLFLDSRREPSWVLDVLPQQLVQESFDLEVLHEDSVGHCTTSFGVPPVGPCKQLVLVGGRARRLSTPEMFRLGGDEAALQLYRESDPTISDFTLRSKPGKSLQYNLAFALVSRLRRRITQYLDVRHGAPSYAEASVSRVSSHVNLAAGSPAVLIFVAFSGHSPSFLVDDDLEQLPLIEPYDGEVLTHRTVMKRAMAITRCFEDEVGFVPEAFLAGSPAGSSQLVVACPLGDVNTARLPGSSLRWASLGELHGSSVYPAVALAYGTTLTMLDHEQVRCPLSAEAVAQITRKGLLPSRRGPSHKSPRESASLSAEAVA